MSLVMSIARLQAQRRTVAAAAASLTAVSSPIINMNKKNMDMGGIRSFTIPVDVEHFTSGWNITDM